MSKRHIRGRRRGPRLDRGRGDLHPSRGRRRPQGQGRGLLIARFDHFDNRVGDPNLHTHSAILNRVLAEGKWTTIDGQVLYKANVAASERYNTRVADLVARKLGVTFAPRPDTAVGKQPVYEVEASPSGCSRILTRRAQIEDRQAELAREYKDKYGKNPPRRCSTRRRSRRRWTPGTRRTRHDRWQSCARGARARVTAILAGSDPSKTGRRGAARSRSAPCV
ncbi:relaxase domain-containing protein, partial [Rhodococcus hoagii]|nr:relaxase domain-containing protein [Prescottella equi]